MSDLGVPCPAVVQVSVTAPASHRCPFRDELDRGAVRISWTTAFGQTVELHELAALIHSQAETTVSHEQWTADLVAMITAGATVDNLTVTSQWATAGLHVSVAADRGVSA